MAGYRRFQYCAYKVPVCAGALAETTRDNGRVYKRLGRRQSLQLCHAWPVPKSCPLVNTQRCWIETHATFFAHVVRCTHVNTIRNRVPTLHRLRHIHRAKLRVGWLDASNFPLHIVGPQISMAAVSTATENGYGERIIRTVK